MKQADRTIGIDLGGTNVRAGIVEEGQLLKMTSRKINAEGTKQEVLESIFNAVDELEGTSVAGIGVGVPSVVDTKTGVVYDVQNIPSWNEVALKDILEERYKVRTLVNNDANCMALAERHFGLGKTHDNMIGLIIGTGLAGGIIINGQLYEGVNCGAGEFGMVKYLDHHFEYYASGQFFKNVHNTAGEDVYMKAMEGDNVSLTLFGELGRHLGHAIETILFAYDPSLIVLGGSLGGVYHLYKESLWQELARFPYRQSIQNLTIEVSELSNPGVLGAAALSYNFRSFH
ncbi:ROK family protein [Fulvivirga sp. M361]|uniref:ROK family protein n=1 Tax=Fulvivirga sp. M361 TaxID=2594266 RepID=UPI00117A6101|nr:ROK family protein [Fulvivirga sp. M361]TRX59937.1 ROK family protein [Fulvivirga sp. M361]